MKKVFYSLMAGLALGLTPAVFFDYTASTMIHKILGEQVNR